MYLTHNDLEWCAFVKRMDSTLMMSGVGQDVCITFMFAGHDTTASTIMVLLKELPGADGAIEKLREEQQAVVAEHGEALTEAALKAMPYAEAVIREAMRHTPIVGAIPREALQDFELGGYTIRKVGDFAFQFKNKTLCTFSADSRNALNCGNIFLSDRITKIFWRQVGKYRHRNFGANTRYCLDQIKCDSRFLVEESIKC